MDKRKQKLIDLAVAIIILLISIPVMAFCIGGGGVGKAWDCLPRVTSSGEAKAEYAVYKLTYGEKQTVDSVWVNFSRFNEKSGKLKFIFDFTDSEEQAKGTSYMELTRRQAVVENAGEKSFRFIKAVENAGEKSAYVRVCIKQCVSVNEIVFSDKDGNSVKAEFFGAITWKNDKYGFYYSDEVKGVSTAEYSVDSRFLLGNGKSIENAGVNQAELLTAVTSFLSGDGAGVSSTHGPLGVALTSIGVLIFGAGLFGLNFINYLAFIVALMLLYFAGKKVFNDFRYGIAASAVCLVLGLPVSAVIGSAASALALPFIIGAFLLAYDYLLYPVKNSKKIAVSGILFSVAFAIDVHSLVAFMGLAVICVLGAKREITAFEGYKTLKGLEREYGREKYVKRTIAVILRAIVCFLIFPFLIQLLSYGITFFAYANYYASLNGNVFAIFAENTKLLFLKSSASDSLIFGWLIGIGSENSKFYGENVAEICSNPFVAFIGAACAIFIIVLVCSFKAQNEKVKKVFEKNKYESVIGSLVLSVAFVSCFVSLMIFGFYGAYQTYLYAAAAFCFSLPLAFKYLCAINEKTAYFSLSFCAAIAAVFEILFFTEIFQLNFFPSIAQVIFTFKF